MYAGEITAAKRCLALVIANQVGYDIDMEKRTPHTKLSVVHSMTRASGFAITKSALAGADALGIGYDEIQEILLALVPSNFYKSMTTYADHQLWQDVYHVATMAGDVYLKLVVVDNVLVVSFKEL